MFSYVRSREEQTPRSKIRRHQAFTPSSTTTSRGYSLSVASTPAGQHIVNPSYTSYTSQASHTSLTSQASHSSQPSHASQASHLSQTHASQVKVSTAAAHQAPATQPQSQAYIPTTAAPQAPATQTQGQAPQYTSRQAGGLAAPSPSQAGFPDFKFK